MLAAILLILIATIKVSAAEDTPILETKLFTLLATNCTNIEYGTWKHPLKKVFLDLHVIVRKAQLCNNNKYPVFYLDIGPLGDPDYKVYAKAKAANGGWPFAFVIPGRSEIIYVSYPKSAEPSVEYGYFSESFDQDDFFDGGGFEQLSKELKQGSS